MEKINLEHKFSLFDEHWKPTLNTGAAGGERTVAELERI